MSALPSEAVALAGRIRACRRCYSPWTICATHAAELNTLYPKRCKDPDCYACDSRFNAGEAARAEQ